ncbi:MAG: Flp pilus assembly protein CpaB [Acidimicrobiia bacterium]|nr:Flp pilus assembly protein CpaB [Acidimicrobiia bacterium]
MGRRAIVLVIALALAGIAAFAIFQYLQGIEDEVQAGQVQVPVFRAIQPIAEGTEGSFILQGAGALYEESTEQQQDLPADAITTPNELNDVLSGRVSAGPVSANGILTRNQWVELSVEITPLAELIEPGFQAITISPGNIQGVNGFVEAGDLINAIISLDIEFNLTALGQESDFGIPVEDTGDEAAAEDEIETVSYTRYVLQGLRVLAVGSDVRPDPDADPTVEVNDGAATNAQVQAEGEEGAVANSTVFTLEVDHETAERLVFAQNAGQLYYTLNPKDEYEEVLTRGVTIENLFEGDLVEDIFGN